MPRRADSSHTYTYACKSLKCMGAGSGHMSAEWMCLQFDHFMMLVAV